MSSSRGVVIASNQTPVSVTGTVITIGQGSIAAAIVSGSISATFTPPANQSVSGVVGASIIGLPNINVGGSVVTFQGTVPWTVSSVYGNIAGSVAAFLQSTNASVITVGTAAANQSVSGTVTANQGTNAGFGSRWPVIISNGSQSANVTATSMLSVTVDNVPNVNTAGSVVAFQGTNPWVMGSIVGTYGEDIPSTAADKGLFTLGIRNDTVASLVSTDLDYTGWSTDSAGRHLVKPFSADEVRLDTATSVVSGSVTALFNSVIGLRNYVTDIMIANTGSVATLVTFKDGSTSILGYTIAPAGGGSNINGMAFPLRTAPAQDFTFQAATPTSILYVTAKGYKGP